MISFGMWGSTLSKCGTDVTKLAKEGKFDPVIDRKAKTDGSSCANFEQTE